MVPLALGDRLPVRGPEGGLIGEAVVTAVGDGDGPWVKVDVQLDRSVRGREVYMSDSWGPCTNCGQAKAICDAGSGSCCGSCDHPRN